MSTWSKTSIKSFWVRSDQPESTNASVLLRRNLVVTRDQNNAPKMVLPSGQHGQGKKRQHLIWVCSTVMKDRPRLGRPCMMPAQWSPWRSWWKKNLNWWLTSVPQRRVIGGERKMTIRWSWGSIWHGSCPGVIPKTNTREHLGGHCPVVTQGSRK